MNANECDAWLRQIAALFPSPLKKEVVSHLRKKSVTLDHAASITATERYREEAAGAGFFLNEFLRYYVKPTVMKKIFYRVHWRDTNGCCHSSAELFDDAEKALLRAAILCGTVKTNYGEDVPNESVSTLVQELESVPRGTLREIVSNARMNKLIGEESLPPSVRDWDAFSLRRISSLVRRLAC